MEFDKVLSDILEVKKPWFIREIDVHKGTKSVNVFIDYEDLLIPQDKKRQLA